MNTKYPVYYPSAQDCEFGRRIGKEIDNYPYGEMTPACGHADSDDYYGCDSCLKFRVWDRR